MRSGDNVNGDLSLRRMWLSHQIEVGRISANELEDQITTEWGAVRILMTCYVLHLLQDAAAVQYQTRQHTVKQELHEKENSLWEKKRKKMNHFKIWCRFSKSARHI